MRGGDRASEALLAALLVPQVANLVWSLLRPAPVGRAPLAGGAVLLSLSALGLPTPVTLLVGIAVLGWAASVRSVAATASYREVLAVVGLMWRRYPDTLKAVSAVVAFSVLGSNRGPGVTETEIATDGEGLGSAGDPRV